MKIFGLISRNSGPGFHRIHVPLLLMPEVDCYITNAVEEKDFDEKRPDLIYYNRFMSDEVLRLQGKYHFRVAVDVDDYWHLDPHHIMYKESKEKNIPAHQEKHLMIADVVTTTNERLAEMAYKINKNVHVIPNAIPKNCDYFPIQRTQSGMGHIRIFYQGSVTHEKDLEILRKTIQNLDRERFMMVLAGYTEQLEWERMADCYTNYKKMPGVVLPGVGVAEYYSNYQYADVCVVPLLSTKFNGYKSNLKVLEAAHSGLPVICSHVHPYKNMEGVMYVKRKEDWKYWLDNRNEWKVRASILKSYVDREYNFEKINLKRKEVLK
jgi:glycosyltransferase involved in cell wall biosynthesis